MLVIRLPEDLENQLDVLVRKTGHSKDWFAGEAIRAYLEDMEDYDLAAAAVARDEPRRDARLPPHLSPEAARPAATNCRARFQSAGLGRQEENQGAPVWSQAARYAWNERGVPQAAASQSKPNSYPQQSHPSNEAAPNRAMYGGSPRSPQGGPGRFW